MRALQLLPITAVLLIMSMGCQQRMAIESAYDAERERNRWPTEPAAPWPVVGIPKLAEPFVVDGELNEWSSGLSVPVRSDSLAIYYQGGQKWLGGDDASMDCFVAWTADGICVASAARDNELFNNRPPDVPWDHDCATIVIESTEPASADPTAPAWKVALLAIPPRGETPAETYTPPDTIKSEITTVVKRCPGGYIVEALFPWEALPELKGEEGTELSLRFSLIDYDRRHGDQVVPFALSWHMSWYHSISRRPPGDPAHAVLIDQLTRSAETNLESEVFLDVDHCPPAGDASLSVNLDLGINIGREARAVELLVTDWQSQRVLQRRLPLESTTTTAGVRKSASYTWDIDCLPYGQHKMTARVLGDGDECLGFVERDILIVRGLEEETLGLIEKADPGAIAESQPFHAIDWLEVATNLERFRQDSSWQDIPGASFQARQLAARVALLESGRLPTGDDDLFDLLALTTDPEAQVIVEYFPEGQGHVSMYWGPVPIATVTVQQFPDEASARSEFESGAGASSAMVASDYAAAGTPAAARATTHRILQGRWIISATSASAEVAEGAVAAVAAGKPITLAQIDAFRAALAKEIEVVKVTPLMLAPDDMKLLVGDVHMHTIFSDGSYSPVYMALQTFCSGMDFTVISDHNDIVGAQLAQAYCERYGLAHPVIVGEEVTMSWAHLNAYPLRELVDWELPPFELVRSAHAQGAAVQWNHPDQGSEWGEIGFAHGIGPLGVEAWEHVPPAYEQWRQEGKLPTLVGSTDEHMGYFFNLERSIILAPSAGGVDLAEAVRRGNVCIFEPTLPNVVYGAPHLIGRVREALLEGAKLRRRKAARIQAALADLDITGLISTSGVRRVNAEQAEELLRVLHSHENP